MTLSRHAAVAAMNPAQRARTVLASCGLIRWHHDGQDIAVPFVEEAGSLLLIVPEELRQELLQRGSGSMTVDVTPALGSLRMSGDYWPVASTVALGLIEEMRAGHLQCVDCPGRRLSQVVGLQITAVELTSSDGSFGRVDLDDYVLAQPDWVLALGVQIQNHVNTAHGADVETAASALSGRPVGQLIAAQVDWIDGHGVELTMIDETGGRTIRCAFPVPVVDPDSLSDAVHLLLEHAAAGSGRWSVED